MFYKYRTPGVNNFHYRSRSSDRIRFQLSEAKTQMNQLCLFEELIYNLHAHFARVNDENDLAVMPVIFQKKRLCFSDNIDLDMQLTEKFYSKFRMLSKGHMVNLDDLNKDDQDLIEKIWATKIEFILVLKEYAKTDILPIKSEIGIIKIENLVSKKKGDLSHLGRQRTKMKDFLDASCEFKKLNEVTLESKPTTKFKMLVTQTIFKNSIESPRRKLAPILTKATRKILGIKKLLGIHQANPLRIRRFSLKATSATEKLLMNLGNLASHMDSPKQSYIKSKALLIEPSRSHKSFAKSVLSPFNKKFVVESYLRNKYVSNKKLF